MDTNVLVFSFGLLLLALFGWYFFTDSDRIKRILGSALAVLLVAFCLQVVNPPNDVRDSDGHLIKAGKIQRGLDLKGGTSFLIRLIAEPNELGEVREITPTMVDQAIEVIRKRVDALGTSEPVLAPSGSDRILVQIPGLDPQKLNETREQLKKVAKLEFRLVHPMSEMLVPAIEAGTEVPPIGYSIQPMDTERGGKPVTTKLLLKNKPDLLGARVTSAGAYFDVQGWGVGLEFDAQGADEFQRLTKEVAQQRSAMAIVLDGKIQSAPGVDHDKYAEGIFGGRAQISGGNMTEKEARNLASALENPLAVPVAIEEERSASASLGDDAINSGIKAGLVGVALTFICVLLYYRFAGLIANLALAINVILLFGAMAAFNVVLTLPGIAGIILTVGMAVDANVLIYERLREELATGKSLKASLSAAFDKAFSAIFDSNITTLITAVILFWQATGPIKGFAVTLTMGIIASMFAALVVTRNLFDWAVTLGWIKTISMTNLINATNFDFISKRKPAITFSILVMIGSLALFAIRGEKNFGVDFKGGDRLVLEAGGPRPTDNEVRMALAQIKITDTVVQTEKSAAKEFLTVRSPADTSTAISEHLQKTFPDAKFTEQGVEKVGKLVGDELARKSLIALGLGIIGIFIYVTIQFEMSFAIGAIVALLHDVIITIGIFALAGREMSLIIVGAILTIAGYSINDTIVVFDRIREGIKAGRSGSVAEIMNRSINETLSRTILTGGTTLLTTLGLYLLGGPVLNDFAFTIIIGVLVGTYSSIYIAAPIVLWWSGKGGHKLRTEIKKSELPKPATA